VQSHVPELHADGAYCDSDRVLAAPGWTEDSRRDNTRENSQSEHTNLSDVSLYGFPKKIGTRSPNLEFLGNRN
jgi:hypothetical protein